MISTEVRELVPKKLKAFEKIGVDRPYIFHKWAKDVHESECLYYKFELKEPGKQNIKRVLLEEIEAAKLHLSKHGNFNRDSYRSECPKSDSSGPCGYAVIGRVLEALGYAKYSSRKSGFVSI